jgi:hypothetical protein
MDLLRKCVVVATASAAIGCHDASGPPGLPANYMLVSVNGQPLPAIISPIPESPTVLDGTLFLDGAGNAVVRDHERVMIAPGDVTYTTNYTYTIKDNKIQFQIECVDGPTALCPRSPSGTFVGSHLILDLSGTANELVYDYVLLMPD